MDPHTLRFQHAMRISRFNTVTTTQSTLARMASQKLGLRSVVSPLLLLLRAMRARSALTTLLACRGIARVVCGSTSRPRAGPRFCIRALDMNVTAAAAGAEGRSR